MLVELVVDDFLVDVEHAEVIVLVHFGVVVDEVDRQYELGQTINNLSEKLAAIKPLIDKLETVFLSKDDQLEFITTIEELAVRNKIVINIALPADN